MIATFDNVAKQAEQHARVLDHNVSFGHTTSAKDENQNIDGQKAAGTSPGTANTPFTLNHSLKRPPIGFIVISKNKHADLWMTGSTVTTVTLESDTASVQYVIMII